MKDLIKETLAFTELTPEEKEKRGILGRLYGPCADILNPTRNGRLYPDEAWEHVWNNELVKESFENGGIFGELDHPVDREEICSEKIAICMPERPKKDKDGHLIAYFDILDTPCGRITYQLAKYGYKLGISSRGTGELITDDEGNEIVDPESYDFTCFDIVITPSVKDARLTMSEGLDKNKLALNKALTESLAQSNEDERIVMENTLRDLHIDYTQSQEEVVDNKLIEAAQKLNNVKTEAVNDGSEEMLKSLQEALKEKTRLEAEVKSLQEQLAVGNTKVDKLNEDLEHYKDATIRLGTLAKKSKDLVKEVNSLKEQIKTNKNSDSTSLTESISKKDAEIKSLKENADNMKAEYEKQLSELNEKYNTLSSNSKDIELRMKKMTSLKENYKKLAFNTVNRYIESKAAMIGVKPEEIKNKLSKSYTVKDIDDICESLQEYNLNMSRLPIELQRNNIRKISFKESKNDNLKVSSMFDDTVDDDLLSLAKLK